MDNDFDLSKDEDDKLTPKMSDAKLHSCINLQLNNLGGVFLFIPIGMLLVVGQWVFETVGSVVFGIALIFLFYICFLSFVKSRYYLYCYQDFKSSKRHCQLENYSVFICCGLAIVLAIVEGSLKEYYGLVLNKYIYYILFKVVFGLYTMFVGFIVFGRSYERLRKLQRTEVKLRKQLKRDGTIKNTYNTNMEGGGAIVSNLYFEASNLSYGIKTGVNLVLCAVLPLYILIEFFAKDGIIGVGSSVMPIILILLPFWSMVYSRFYIFNYKQLRYNSVRFYLEKILLILCVVVYLILIVLLHINSDSTNLFFDSIWYLVVRIILLVVSVLCSVLFVISAVQVLKKCKQFAQESESNWENNQKNIELL